jgi:hypothetical protein
MKRIALLYGLALVLAATGCGGNGGGGDAKATKAQRDIQPDAQQQAESMVLLLSDFPEGWRASASESDESGDEKFRKCLGVDYSGGTKIGEADSKDFAIEDTTKASSSSQIYKDAQQATDAVEEVASGMEGPNAERCYKDLVEETLTENDSKDVSMWANSTCGPLKAWRRQERGRSSLPSR